VSQEQTKAAKTYTIATNSARTKPKKKLDQIKNFEQARDNAEIKQVLDNINERK